MSGLVIRPATPDDASALLEIYAPYVLETAISFEYEVPTEKEFARRIARVLERYPYLVAELEGQAVGYAYAGAFHERAAYSHCAELSIYLRQDMRGQGIGRALYQSLEGKLSAMGILNLYACVAYPPKPDERLTLASVLFHERLGFEIIGRFHACGYKFGRWYDMVWMEKLIGEHPVS